MILTLGTTPAVGRSMIFDKVTIDEVNRAREVIVSPAGKSVNVSRVLRVLGHEVVATGIVGGDTGKIVIAEMASLGVADAWLRTDSPTRVCVTIIDRASGQVTELVEEAPPAHVEDQAKLLAVVDEWIGRCRVIVCSGTIARGISDDLYAQVAQKATGVNPCVVSVEDARVYTRGSLKPVVIVDAKGAALRKSCAHHPVIKCNAAELCDTFGGTLGEAINAALRAGAMATVISDGARPTTVATPQGRWTIDTPKIDVISPIGSGDSLAAGLAAGIERGWAIEEAARLGVACAAANVMTPSAGVVDPTEVDRLFNQLRPIRTL